ncbi:S8 family serine peptidase [Pontiella agarivorans]|uniref:S8 family serine peptidase n=1 Tax=Pontiella agarivorans TaxID=3038953 RepID=A0ABU5MVV7_9BACT|nr:S8 family serine peptidase [Pontiella agarivorans]MDZ8118371.1 S8 family serine peptidase [Pontiella agarivorans]
MISFFWSVVATAQPHRTFAERPARRTERADEMRRQAAQSRAVAKVWAERRGLELRHDDGTRISEIMAVRNGRPLIFTTQNENAAVSTTADRVRNELGVNGSGVRVGIWDGGLVLTNHQELAGRVVVGDAVAAHYHASHVGGTIAAAGVNLRAEGMAPAAELFSCDWNSNTAEMILNAAAEPGETNRLYISNHSYGISSGWLQYYWTNPYTHESGWHWWGDIEGIEGDPYFGQYSYWVRYWDEIVYDAPYHLIFKAAGNERNDNPQDGDRVYYTLDDGETWTNVIYDSAVHVPGDGDAKGGYDTIPYYGNAKNIMTVGAVTDAVTDAVVDGSRSLSKAALTEFSSWGPADDGRIKPDIVANGMELFSCNSTSTNAYAVRSGTSMACPNASGSAALLVDYYDHLFPEQAMRASTLKALIIHTADDLGRPGPDYQFGWGLMNTRRTAQQMDDLFAGNRIAIKEERLRSGETDIFRIFADGSAPLKVTLCWTDPPGGYSDALDDRTSMLVNDLDLKIIAPDGTVHYPFRLSYADPEALPETDGKNHVDNVEQVVIEFPESGTYSIEVTHADELQDGEQHYSLITSGAVSDADQDGLPDVWENRFFQTFTGSEISDDSDGDGLNNLEEYIAGSDPTDPASTFSIASVYPLPVTNENPVVIKWDGLPGRIYRVYWTYHLQYVPFELISGEIRWPVNSYTDTVERIGNAALYRIDVRLDD